MKKIILIISIFSIAFNSFAQTNFNVLFEVSGDYSLYKHGQYGSGDLIIVNTFKNGNFVMHPKSKKAYSCDRVIGKNCDISQRDFLILEKDKKFGVIDFDGEEIFPISKDLMPEYDCDNKKWSFIKPLVELKNNTVDFPYLEGRDPQSDDFELKSFLKKYKYVHSFENGYYWVSEKEEREGGLLSSNMKWIIPLSDKYWFKDHQNKDFFELIPLESDNDEIEERYIVDFETGTKKFTKRHRGLKVLEDKVIYKQNIDGNSNTLETVLYDLSLKKEISKISYTVKSIYKDLVIVNNDVYNGNSGLYSLKELKLVLPLEYKQVEILNDRFIIGKQYVSYDKYDTHSFKILERVSKK